MDYSFDDEVRSAEIFRQAVGDLLQDIRVYKCHLDEAVEFPDQLLWESTMHKSASRRWQLKFLHSNNAKIKLMYNIVLRKSGRSRKCHSIFFSS